MKRIEELPDVLTVPQAARFLGISKTMCYEAIAQGRLPAKKFGRRVLISKRELATYLGYGGTPKVVPKVPTKVIFGIAQLARSLSEMAGELAKICEEIGGEYVEQGGIAGTMAPGPQRPGASAV